MRVATVDDGEAVLRLAERMAEATPPCRNRGATSKALADSLAAFAEDSSGDSAVFVAGSLLDTV